MLDKAVEACRRGVNSGYFQELHTQMRNSSLIEVLSEPQKLEHMTGLGFETTAGGRAWLERLRRHLFENGPYPVVHDLE